LDKFQEQRRRPCPSFTGSEQPIFLAKSQWADGIFRRVVVGLESGVIKIPAQGFPLIQAGESG
jgi:hypothetical protein